MSILKFYRAQVQKLIEHAEKSKKHRCGYGEKKGKPGLFLVHDDGIYLMSSGEPRLLEDPETKDKKNARSFVAQAQGTDPKKDADWHGTARELVGGDDFAERLSLLTCKDWLGKNAGRTFVELEFSETQIKFVGYSLPESKAAPEPA